MDFQEGKVFSVALKKINPDIIHAHDAPMLAVATLYKKYVSDVKVVFDAHEIYEQMSGRGVVFQFVFRFYINMMAKKVDVFITINNSNFKVTIKSNS